MQSRGPEESEQIKNRNTSGKLELCESNEVRQQRADGKNLKVMKKI